MKEDRYELDGHEIYNLLNRLLELSTKRDPDCSRSENRLQKCCFQTLLSMLMEQEYIASKVAGNAEFKGNNIQVLNLDQY